MLTPFTSQKEKELWDEAIAYLWNRPDLTFVCDHKRHLVCVPYSKENLHEMARILKIHLCWFHRDHYDIPKKRISEIRARCVVVDPKYIVQIIKTKAETCP